MIPFVTGEQLTESVGHRITLQPRIVDAFGEKVVAIRIMPGKDQPVRKAVAARLGTKAVFTSVPPPTEKPAEPKKPDGPQTQQNLMDTGEHPE